MFKPIARLVSIGLLLGATALFAQSPKQPASGGRAQGSTTASSSSSSAGAASSSSSTSPPKKIEPGSLEDQLDKALNNNPDIRAAEAKVRDAEAQLNRVRHQVVAKVVALRTDIDLSKKMLAYSLLNFNRVQKLRNNGTVSKEEVDAAEAVLDKSKAELAKLEGDMDAMIGSWKHVASAVIRRDDKLLWAANAENAIRVWNMAIADDDFARWVMRTAPTEKTAKVQSPMADRIRACLNKKVKIEVKEPLPFSQALNYFFDAAALDVPVRPLGKIEAEKMDEMTFPKAELQVGAWLQVLQDSAPNVRFVVRDYGILVTTRDRVPDGAMTVEDFWKQDNKPKAIVPDMKKP